jgi:ABC-type uncharacterized transport system permease subunit
MLFLVTALKALAEVSLLALLAQGVLHLFAGAARDRNPIYGLFATVNRPVLRATRFVAPRFVADPHIGLLAFFLVLVLWFALVLAKVHYYLAQGVRPG